MSKLSYLDSDHMCYTNLDPPNPPPNPPPKPPPNPPSNPSPNPQKRLFFSLYFISLMKYEGKCAF